MKTIAYHFVADKLRDGRAIPPDGVWLEHTGKVEMCESGLHASQKAVTTKFAEMGITV
jgi:hypothetical protein